MLDQTDSVEIVEDATTYLQTAATVVGSIVILCYTYRAGSAVHRGIKRMKENRQLRRDNAIVTETEVVPA